MAPRAELISAGDLVGGGNLLNAIVGSSLDVVDRSQSISFDGVYDVENQAVDQEVRGGSTFLGVGIPRRPMVYSLNRSTDSSRTRA